MIPWEKDKDKNFFMSIQFSFEIFVDEYEESYISHNKIWWVDDSEYSKFSGREKVLFLHFDEFHNYHYTSLHLHYFFKC